MAARPELAQPSSRLRTARLALSLILPICLPLALCAGCGGGTTYRAGAVPPARASTANAVLFRAISLVGTPYRYGGNTPQGGFDCSGLVGYVFRDAAGVALPRTSSGIAEVGGSKLEATALEPGDLVFFAARRKVSHVGIYVGDGRFVHAPNSGGTVRLDRLDGAWWGEHFVYGKRVL